MCAHMSEPIEGLEEYDFIPIETWNQLLCPVIMYVPRLPGPWVHSYPTQLVRKTHWAPSVFVVCAVWGALRDSLESHRLLQTRLFDQMTWLIAERTADAKVGSAAWFERLFSMFAAVDAAGIWRPKINVLRSDKRGETFVELF